jgi:thioester reductase-like protein
MQGLPSQDIALVGIGLRVPGASDPRTFYQNLLNEVDAIRAIPAERTPLYQAAHASNRADRIPNFGGFIDGLDRFDAQFFGFSRKEVLATDPMHRLMLHAAWEALEDAAIDPRSLRGRPVAVYMGVIATDGHDLATADARSFDLYSYVNTTFAALAGRVAYTLDTRGEAVSVDTACSSSLVAMHLGVSALRRGDAEIALVGGANALLVPEFSQAFARAGMLAADGRCKAFDARGDGFVRSEGVVCVALMPVARAVEAGHPIYAVIKGTRLNHDGGTGQYKTPNVAGQTALLRDLYRATGLDPLDTHYVEAHGTGTRAGDPVEVEAIANVLCAGRDPARALLIGSVKTNVGHCEGASGLVGVAKVALALKHGVIPRSLHFEEPNPNIAWDRLALRVASQSQPWPVRPGERARAGVSAFGLTGVNSHVLLEQWNPPQETRRTIALRPHLWVMSDPTETGLRANVKAQLEAWERDPETDAQRLTLTAAAHRPQFEHRVAFVGEDASELRGAAREWLEHASGEPAASAAPDGVRVAFVFPGQGAQWPGMARELLNAPGVFRETLLRADAVIEREAGFSVVERLSDEAPTAHDDIATLQPTLFALQLGLAALWESWGVTPAAVVGHSMGEVAAACVAGILSIEDAAAVICRRSRLMRRLRGQGAMLLVELSRDAAAELVRGRERFISIAVSNGPKSTVLSGDVASLRPIAMELEEKGAFCRQVKVDVASHSPQMDAIAHELIDRLSDLRPRRGQIPLYSTVRPLFGRRPEDGERFDAAYWWENLRQPVLFADAVDSMIAHGIETFVEISPHPLLCQAVLHSSRRTPRVMAVPSMRRGEPVRNVATKSLGELYKQGASVEWRGVIGDAELVRLPRRVWLDEAYPVDFARHGRRGAPAGASQGHPWLTEPWSPPGRDDEAVFRTTVSLETSAWLTDHQVQGEVIFPAAGYIELAVSAVARLFAGRAGHVTLSGVSFERAHFLGGERRPSLELLIRREGGTLGSFEFYGRDDADAPQHRLASGAFRWSDETSRPQVEAPSRVQGDDATRFYDSLRRIGMEYGPSFQGIARARREEGGEVVAELLAPPWIADEVSEFTFHPSMLDAAFQSCLFALGETSASHLPVALKEIRVWPGLCREARVSTHVTTSGAGFDADLRVFSSEGEVLVELKGLRADALERPEGEVLRDIAFEHSWAPSDLGDARPTEPGAWLVLSDGSIVGRTLVERLSRAGHRVFEVRRTHRAADEFHYDAASRVARVKSDRVDHWEALFHKLQESAPDGLLGTVYLWGMDENTRDDARPEEVESATLAVTWPLVEVLQRAAGHSYATGRVWITTHAAFTSNLAAHAAVASSLWGLGRVIENEMPGTRCTRVDLDERNEAAAMALCEEVLAGSSEREVRVGRDARYVARIHRASGAEPPPVGEGAFVVEWSPGLSLVEVSADTPASSEVAVQVTAALVQRARGEDRRLLRGCVGQVVGVGAAIDGINAGDTVLVFGVPELRSHLTLSVEDVVKVPEGVTPDAALASAACYALADYALGVLAGARSRDAVLVVGDGAPAHAAVAVAHARGLRAALVGASGEGSLNPSSVRESLGGRGVDVVLSLGSVLPRELDQVLRPLARVIHLGVGARVSHLLANVTYARADLTELWRERRDEVRAFSVKALNGLASGDLAPLPLPSPVPSLRELAHAEPDGTYAVTLDPGALPIAPARDLVRHDGAYVISGGAGGLGVAITEWLVGHGAREVVLLGRRAPDAATDAATARLSVDGARVRYAQCDVAREEDVARTFTSLSAEGLRVRGVVHAAGVLADGIALAQSPERFREVFAPKVRASWALHRALEALPPVDFFVMFSSAAGLLGSPGQSNYAAANAFMDGLSRARRRLRLPAQSLQWGPWAEVGLATLHERRERLAQRGLSALSADEGARAFGAALTTRRAELMITRLDAHAWARAIGAESPSPTLTALLRTSLAPPVIDPYAEAAAKLRAELARGAEASDATTHVEEYLKVIVAKVLGRSAERVSASASLSGLGVDSLMAMELRSLIESHLAVSLSVTSLLRGASLREVAKSLLAQVTRRRESRPAPVSPLTADASLGAELRAPGPAKSPLGRTVLLTGATGFLGVYLLDALIRKGVERVQCVVRAPSASMAELRLRAHAASYGFAYEDWGARVAVTVGDLAEPRFGLDLGAWEALASEVDAVVHNGANVNFLFEYPELRRENVVSTREALALACEQRAKAIHYVSTWAVFGAGRYAGVTIDEGATADEPPHGGYAQSKYASERMLLAARERGVTANIYRPTLVGWDDATGRYNPREAFVRLVSTCLATGCAPDVDFALPITPVRYVAERIVAVAAENGATNGTFHPTTEAPVGFRQVVTMLREAGHAIEDVTWGAFRARAAQQASATGFAAFGKVFPETLSPTGTSYIELLLPERASRFTASRSRALLPHAAPCPSPSRASLEALVRQIERDGLLRTTDKT